MVPFIQGYIAFKRPFVFSPFLSFFLSFCLLPSHRKRHVTFTDGWIRVFQRYLTWPQLAAQFEPQLQISNFPIRNFVKLRSKLRPWSQAFWIDLMKSIQNKGAPGLESWTGGWLVSPATGSEKKMEPLYFELRMYIWLHLGQFTVLVCVNIVEYYGRSKKKSNFKDDDYKFSSSVMPVFQNQQLQNSTVQFKIAKIARFGLWESATLV